MHLDTVVGKVTVHTTTNRGYTPEEVAERALLRIISVGQNSHPILREQAEAFQDNIRSVLVYYMHEAIKSDRTTLITRFREAGYGDLIGLLKD